MEVIEINWSINPFRGDVFEQAWTPVAEAALDYGATAWSLLRSKDDRLHFTQLAHFDSKLAWERYWLSEEVSEARIAISGWYQVPLLPKWHAVVGAGSRERGEAAVSPARAEPW